MMTAIFGIVIVYIYAIIGYVYLSESFALTLPLPLPLPLTLPLTLTLSLTLTLTLTLTLSLTPTLSLTLPLTLTRRVLRARRLPRRDDRDVHQPARLLGGSAQRGPARRRHRRLHGPSQPDRPEVLRAGGLRTYVRIYLLTD